MSQIASLLKSEITRLSKKTTKADLTSLRSALSGQKRSISQMRRQLATLERELKVLAKSVRHSAAPAAQDATAEKAQFRFQVRGLKSLRARLGVSAEDFGRLVGTSGQTIYNWEAGKATPRRTQLESLARVRALGKREALSLLAEQGR